MRKQEWQIIYSNENGIDYLDKRTMDDLKFFLLSPPWHFYNFPVWAYIDSDNKMIVSIFQLLYVSKRKSKHNTSLGPKEFLASLTFPCNLSTLFSFFP